MTCLNCRQAIKGREPVYLDLHIAELAKAVPIANGCALIHLLEWGAGGTLTFIHTCRLGSFLRGVQTVNFSIFDS